MAASTLITVAPTGAEAAKAAVPALPVTLDELVATAKECEAAGAAVIHVHIRDDDGPAHSGPGPAHRYRGGAARGHRPHRPALHRGRGDRQLRRPAGGPGRRPGRLLADLRHGQLRRRRVPQPLAVHQGPVPADPGAPGGPGVRAVRPRARGDAAPAAGRVRPARRRARALRPGHGRARRHAGGRGHAGRRRGRAAGRRHLVGDRDRPDHAAGAVRRARRRRSPAGRHGGHAVLRPGPPVARNAELVERAAELARLAQRPPMRPAEARAFLAIPAR